MSWKSRIWTILAVLTAPFILLYLFIYILFSKWPDMECINMHPDGCEMFINGDCLKCSLYEPKAAYQRRS